MRLFLQSTEPRVKVFFFLVFFWFFFFCSFVVKLFFYLFMFRRLCKAAVVAANKFGDRIPFTANISTAPIYIPLVGSAQDDFTQLKPLAAFFSSMMYCSKPFIPSNGKIANRCLICVIVCLIIFDMNKKNNIIAKKNIVFLFNTLNSANKTLDNELIQPYPFG